MFTESRFVELLSEFFKNLQLSNNSEALTQKAAGPTRRSANYSRLLETSPSEAIPIYIYLSACQERSLGNDLTIVVFRFALKH